MKKLLFFLSALLLSSVVTASTTPCDQQLAAKNNLKEILEVTDLGVVPQTFLRTKPTVEELKSQLFNLNHKLETKNITISNITDNAAIVIGDGIFYTKDKIKITYQYQKQLVDGVNIGKFATNGQQPTVQDIKTRIHEQYPYLEIEHLKIIITSKKTAIISDNDYQVTVNFSIDDSIDLKTIIKKDLTVKTNGKDRATNADVMTALNDTYQEKLNTTVIAIKDLVATSATIISTDQKKYTGKVTVNLNLDIRIALKNVINKGLNKIAINSKTINVADVTNALAKQYPALKMHAIAVMLQANNAIIKSINQNIYILVIM